MSVVYTMVKWSLKTFTALDTIIFNKVNVGMKIEQIKLNQFGI